MQPIRRCCTGCSGNIHRSSGVVRAVVSVVLGFVVAVVTEDFADVVSVESAVDILGSVVVVYVVVILGFLL